MATTTRIGRRIGGTNVTTATAARWSASMLASFVASQIGGLLMAAVLCVWYAVGLHTQLLQPLTIIASYRYGDAALYSLQPSGYLWALAFHAGVCAVWGMVFGLSATLLRVDKNRWAPIALGVAIGLASQIVDINLVTPVLMSNLHGHDLWAENVPPAASWVGHVVFGLGFAFFAPMFRSLWLRWSGRADDLVVDDPRIR